MCACVRESVCMSVRVERVCVCERGSACVRECVRV